MHTKYIQYAIQFGGFCIYFLAINLIGILFGTKVTKKLFFVSSQPRFLCPVGFVGMRVVSHVNYLLLGFYVQ